MLDDLTGKLRIRITREHGHTASGHVFTLGLGRKMAGVEGFEPTNAGIKTRCLNHLATPQLVITGYPPVLCHVGERRAL